MNLPEITHLQFQILGILMGSERSGLHVRDQLKRQGIRKSGPSFYQMMARLEDAEFVTGRYQQKEIDGQVIKERWYKITGAGSKAWRATSAFYAEQTQLVQKWGTAHA
jgi:DNA-binding PadR family transcriptional regulator